MKDTEDTVVDNIDHQGELEANLSARVNPWTTWWKSCLWSSFHKNNKKNRIAQSFLQECLVLLPTTFLIIIILVWETLIESKLMATNLEIGSKNKWLIWSKSDHYLFHILKTVILNRIDCLRNPTDKRKTLVRILFVIKTLSWTLKNWIA